MKLNEERLSFQTLSNHFWHKPYQEINFESHLNGVLLSIKILSDLHMPRFILIFLCAYFGNEIERFRFWKSLKCF